MSEKDIQSLGFQGSIYWKKGAVPYADLVFSWYQRGANDLPKTEAVVLPRIPSENPEVFNMIITVAKAIWGDNYGDTHFAFTSRADAFFNDEKLDATWLRISEHVEVDDETIEEVMDKHRLFDNLDDE